MTTKRFYIIILLVSLWLSPVYAANRAVDIVVVGLQGDLLTNVQSQLLIDKRALFNKSTPATINAFYNHAPQSIASALQPYGYFDVTVKKRLQQTKTGWLATFDVQLGKPVKITQVDVRVNGDASENPEVQAFIKAITIKRGDILSIPAYNTLKDQLFQTVNNQGYIKAFIDVNKIEIDRKRHSARIIIHVQSGTRYYFGIVTFESSSYAPHFLQRFIPFSETEPFSSQKLIDFQQELSSSYYFKQVVVTPDLAHIQGNRVPVKISVTVPKSKKYSLGIGYGTFTGPRLTAGLSLRRLTDTGQHFDAQLRLSSVLASLAAKYYIPGSNPLTDQWILGVDWQKFSPKNGNSNSKTLSGGYTKKYGSWESSLYLNYLLERYQINDDPNRNGEFLYPSWNLNYLKSDDPMNPRFARSLNISLSGASKSVLSSTSMLQGQIKSKLFLTPLERTHLIVRGDLGYTVVHDLVDLPLSMYFFAGGITSIRGFNDSSIGPGKYLMVGSVEVRRHVYGDVAVAAFVDMGNATNHFGDPIQRSEGIGLVYESMIGPVKIYGAQAMTKRGHPRGIEFSIGPEF